MSRPLVLAGLFAFVLLSACEDPSNVGIGLIGEEGGEPVLVTVTPASVDTVAADDLTANPDLILVGSVDDPLMGSVAAASYVDLGTPSRSSAFTDGTVTEATLHLRRTYAYGDTTGSVTLALRSVPEEWSFQVAPTDTTLPAGDVITEVTFAASDTLVEIALPDAWLSANDAVLRGDDFSTSFHGFKIEPVAGDAVVGFSADSSRFVAVSGETTVEFGLARQFASLERRSAPSLPPGRVALQDGAGPFTVLTFDLEDDRLVNNSLNRVVFRIPVDTLLLPAEDAGFVRPRVQTLRLLGVTDDDRSFLLGEANYDDGAYVFDSAVLRQFSNPQAVLQRVLLGELTFDRYELRVPATINTIDAVALYGADAETGAPTIVFTVTRVDA